MSRWRFCSAKTHTIIKIRFIVNRINIHGKCTVKAHNVGKYFGEAVREVCQKRNIKTDVEIGIVKRAQMLKN